MISYLLFYIYLYNRDLPNPLVLHNGIFIVVIGVLTAWLTFLTTKGSFTNKSFKLIRKQITKRGRLALYLLIAMILTLVAQECNNQNMGENKDYLFSKEHDLRDSIITNGIKTGVDSNSKILFRNMSEAFAKNNLKVDTLRREVVKIRDSIKTTVNNYAQDDPVLMIEQKGLKLKSKDIQKSSYELTFKSVDAGSSNHIISTAILVEFKNGVYDFGEIDFFPKNYRIPKNGTSVVGFEENLGGEIAVIYLNVKGKYKNLDLQKDYSIDLLYKYESKDSLTSTVLNPYRNDIIDIMERIKRERNVTNLSRWRMPLPFNTKEKK